MKKAVFIIKIAVVAALLVSLVCLSLIYMSFYRNEETVEFTPKMDEAVRDKVYRAGYVGLMNETLVSPYFLGFSFGGERVGYIGRGAVELFSEITFDMSNLIGPDARIVAADERAIAEAIDGDFVYVRFRFELPRSIIYFMLNPDKILDEVGDEYIYDIFIPISRSQHAVMRDMRGNIYSVVGESSIGISKNTFSPYNDIDGGFSFAFAMESDADTALLSTDSKSADGFEILAPSDLTAASAVVEARDILSQDKAARALTSLGLVPEKATSHEDDDGITFYDEGRSVRMTKNGTLVYSAPSSQYGIGISDVVGYAFSDNDYTVDDCVGAALVLADQLGIFNGDAFDYAVTRAENDGADTVVGISYVYDGFTVVTDDNYALMIRVTDGKVTSLSATFASAHVYAGSTTVTSARWRARLAVVDSVSPIGISYIQKIRNSRLYLSLAVFDREGGDK